MMFGSKLKWMVRGSTNRVKYDCRSLAEAHQAAEEELKDYPGREVEIYQLVETCNTEISPVKFKPAAP